MGQAMRKMKPPSRSIIPSEPAVPVIKRQSVDIKPAPPEPRIIVEPEQTNVGEWNLPDPNFVSMSQQVVGIITTRPAGKVEHPMASIKEDYLRRMPVDRHTTLLSGPDENSIQSPGTLNHAHIRELFLLHQGKADGEENPLDVESLAKRFNVDAEVLKRVLHHTSLVHFEKTVPTQTTRVNDNTSEQMTDTTQQFQRMERLQVKKQPT